MHFAELFTAQPACHVDCSVSPNTQLVSLQRDVLSAGEGTVFPASDKLFECGIRTETPKVTTRQLSRSFLFSISLLQCFSPHLACSLLLRLT